MRERLRDLVRRIMSGSMMAVAVSHPSRPVAATPMNPAPDESREKVVAGASSVVVQKARPKLVLKHSSANDFSIVSSHRSHRSHSSHRSHYSGSGPSVPAPRPTSPPPAPPPAPPPSSSSGNTEPMTLIGAQGEQLGTRALDVGMRGRDVLELMVLLAKRKFLPLDSINTDQQLFTKAVQNAVKSFQRSKGLKPDGKVGPLLVLLLKELP